MRGYEPVVSNKTGQMVYSSIFLRGGECMLSTVEHFELQIKFRSETANASSLHGELSYDIEERTFWDLFDMANAN